MKLQQWCGLGTPCLWARTILVPLSTKITEFEVKKTGAKVRKK